MSGRANTGGPGGKLLLAISMIAGFWLTYLHGGQFFERSAPILRGMLRESTLWLWSDLIVSLWWVLAWVVFFVIASTSVQITLAFIIGWIASRFL